MGTTVTNAVLSQTDEHTGGMGSKPPSAFCSMALLALMLL